MLELQVREARAENARGGLRESKLRHQERAEDAESFHKPRERHGTRCSREGTKQKLDSLRL